MNETEAIRTRLVTQERRRREAELLVEQSAAMLRAAEALYDAAAPEAGIADALEVLRKHLGADLAVLLCRSGDASPVPLAVVPAGAASELPAARDVRHDPWPLAAEALFQPRHAFDLAQVAWRDALPSALAAEYRTLICAPLSVPNEPGMALVMLARQPAAFDSLGHRSLSDMARMLAHGLDRLRLRDRTRVLSGLLQGGRMAGTGADADAPLDRAFHTISRDLAQVADWQAHVVAINGALLTCATGAVDAAIDTALGQLGGLAGVDRAYVFRRGAGETLDNTHEWCAPGVAPMIDQLQGQPMSLLDGHLEGLLTGAPVQIADIATLPEGAPERAVLEAQGIRSLLLVPFLRDGALRGFVGFDSVRAHRDFRLVEVQLLSAVATAVGAVLDRVEAEAALRAERDQLRTTFAALPELVLELDADGVFTGCHAGVQTPPRLQPEEFLGRHYAQVHPPDLTAVMRRLIAQVDRGDGLDGVEYPITVNGVRHWYHATAAARSEGGGHVVVVRDVTTRHTAERQRRLLERASQVTPEAIVLSDVNRRIEWVNPAFERITGWTLEEVRGRDPAEVLGSPANGRATMARMVAAVEDRKPMQGELIARTRSGEDIWLSVNVVPILGPDGSLDGSIGVHSDITALKASGERARRALLAGLDASVDAIGMTDPAGNFSYLNLAHREMFAIPPTEPPEAVNWADLYDPDWAERLRTRAMPLLHRAGSWRGEVTGRSRDGREVRQDLSLSLQPDGGIMCISRDLTEQRRIQEERAGLREALQQAQQRDTVAQVAGGVAHDLNNLIAVIAGSLEILEGIAETPDSPAAMALQRMQRAIETAHTLTGGMARLGRPDLPRGAQDLGRRLADAVDLLGSRRVSRHAVRVALPDAPVTIWANPTELAQVVMNLALNACDSGEADRPAKVTLSALAPGTPLPARTPDAGTFPPAPVAVALFTVSDTGAGIAQAVRSRIFERNFTSKGRAGTGLGLPIVAAILNDNHAALWVDSTPGAGTTMTVAWPASQPDVTQARTPTRRGALPDAPRDGERVPDDLLSGLRVLVVDDLPDVAEVLAEMLEAAGAVAVPESDPQAAKEMLAEAPGLWSVLLSDLHMPGVDGLALARFAATLSPPVPTVMVTARPEALAHTTAPLAAVLCKPAQAAHLARTVRAVAEG